MHSISILPKSNASDKSDASDSVLRSKMSWTAVLMISGILTIPRSFAEIKIVLIALFLVFHLPSILGRSSRFFQSPVMIFYWNVAFAGIIWAGIGFINGGASQGVFDSLRLYVLWSAAYALVVQALLLGSPLRTVHCALIFAGLAISAINLLGLYGNYFGLNFFSPEVIEILNLRVGFHDGYVQITSRNIGSLFFIIPYFIATLIRKDSIQDLRPLLWLSLFSCLLVAVLSGRRGLWFVILLAPIVCLGLSLISRTTRDNIHLRKLLTFGAAIGALLFFYVIEQYGAATIDFVVSAFSATDERTIQRGYLIDAFLERPILGSGFGLDAGYIRSIESPWLYELTYHQLLFNFGIVGTTYMGLLAVTYFRSAVNGIRLSHSAMIGAFPVLVGVFCFLVGAYSNPYLGSFDFLFIIAMLPLLSAMTKSRRFGMSPKAI